MRYDDRLSTVLHAVVTGARARALKWRQLLDLLAQRAGGLDDAAAQGALRWLEAERPHIPLPDRMAAARAVAGRRIPVPLLLFLAGDAAVVSAPVLRGVRLPPGDWLAILPRLGPTARALLRHRDDLPAPVVQALASFGGSDLVLEAEPRPQAPANSQPAPTPAPSVSALAEPPADGGQIRNLVARIEAFRQQREARRPAPAPAEGPESFRWECGADGAIAWTDAPGRGALIGLPLAGDEAFPTHGPVSARRPFRDVPIDVPAWGPVLLSGVPAFTAEGRFSGYRGIGRRSASVTRIEPAPLAVREMVHELRTPLNAIAGFAEMIGGEYLGPAGADQRARADEIRAEAQRLSEALADIDAAARGAADGEGETDLQDLLVDEHAALEAEARARGVALLFAIEPGLAPAAVPPTVARRLLHRLVGSALRGLGEGTAGRLRVSLRRRDGAAELRLDQPPSTLDGLSARVLRSLVESAGGRFEAGPDAWRAILPIAVPAKARSAAG